MEIFFRTIEEHMWTIILIGFLAYWAVIGVIRAVQHRDED